MDRLMRLKQNDVVDLNDILTACSSQNLTETIIAIFHLRDCRGGKGFRRIGIGCFVWLENNHPAEFRKVMHLIPEYGRWDDLSVFFGHCPEVVQMYWNQLETDLQNMKTNNPVSLASKWLSKKDYKYFPVNPKVLRKTYITPLRSYLQLTESLISRNKWSEVDYTKVPVLAMKKYTKAFVKHDSERFSKYNKKGDSEHVVNSLDIKRYDLVKIALIS